METAKTFISIGLMEMTYDIDRSKFADLVRDKAAYIKYLDSQQYFERHGTDVIKTQKLIGSLRKELQILYGFMQVSDQMKNSYEMTLEKTHDAYESEIERLREQTRRPALDEGYLEAFYTKPTDH